MKTLIRNAKILTMEGVDYPKGDLLMEDGKIAAIGEHIEAEDAWVVEAEGLWALPGYVDAHCHVAMEEDGMGFEGDDINEMTDPITPHLRAIDAFNPKDFALTEAYRHGVTTACTGPGSANVIGGQFAAIKTYGRRADDMVIKAPLALKAAFGENPKRVYSSKQKSPSTRMATAALFREAFTAAQDYMHKRLTEPSTPKDLRKEILVQVLKGEVMLKAHAHRADDILTALRLAREFGIKLTLDHCTEGYLITDYLKEADAGVIIGPLLTDRSKIELQNLSFEAPRILHEAGIKFAMMTDHPVIPLKYLPVCASLAVKEGLDAETALKSITINAAEIVGIAHRVGSLKVGKDADVVLHDGDPLDVRSHVKHVFIDGVEVYTARR